MQHVTSYNVIHFISKIFNVLIVITKKLLNSVINFRYFHNINESMLLDSSQVNIYIVTTSIST